MLSSYKISQSSFEEKLIIFLGVIVRKDFRLPVLFLRQNHKDRGYKIILLYKVVRLLCLKLKLSITTEQIIFFFFIEASYRF